MDDTKKKTCRAKKIAFLLIAAAMIVLPLTACSDEDNENDCRVIGCGNKQYKYSMCVYHYFPGHEDPVNCQVSGCEDKAYTSYKEFGYFCIKHGNEKERELGLLCKGKKKYGYECLSEPVKDGYCETCYINYMKGPGMCLITTCNNPEYTAGLCKEHLDEEKPNKCEVKDCLRYGGKEGLCSKHQYQLDACREIYKQRGETGDQTFRRHIRERLEREKERELDTLKFMEKRLETARINEDTEDMTQQEREEYINRCARYVEEQKQKIAKIEKEIEENR